MFTYLAIDGTIRKRNNYDRTLYFTREKVGLNRPNIHGTDKRFWILMIFYILKIHFSAELRGGFGCRARGRTKDFLLDFTAFHLYHERPDDVADKKRRKNMLFKKTFSLSKSSTPKKPALFSRSSIGET
jgi:hypothetical protein